MERKVGETFTYKGKIYKVIPSLETCNGCTFNNGTVCLDEPLKSRRGKCAYRKDKQSVIFVELNNMEIKVNQLTIDIPKGMEINTKNSDLAKGIIKFKSKSLTYEDILQAYIIDYGSLVISNRNINKLLAISKLMDIAKYYNKDWKPDWNNSLKLKYSIKYNYHLKEYTIEWNNVSDIGSVIFKHQRDAQAVINNPNFKDILDTIYKN